MDRQQERHEHHQKEREDKNDERKHLEHLQESPASTIHPAWFLIVSVVLIASTVLLWTIM